MDHDRNKVEEIVMALLTLTMFDDHGVVRAWKGHDKGEAQARELFARHFGTAG